MSTLSKLFSCPFLFHLFTFRVSRSRAIVLCPFPHVKWWWDVLWLCFYQNKERWRSETISCFLLHPERKEKDEMEHSKWSFAPFLRTSFDADDHCWKITSNKTEIDSYNITSYSFLTAALHQSNLRQNKTKNGMIQVLSISTCLATHKHQQTEPNRDKR